MSLTSKLRAIAETILQLGIGGPQLKNNAGVIEHRNATDAGFVIARAADPVGANDLVTKQSLTNLAGVANVIRYAIGTGATQDSTTALTVNDQVLECWVEITTPYSGGATIEVGQPGALTAFQLTTDNNPQAAGIYQVIQDTTALAGVIRTTVGGGPVAGAGFVVVRYANPNT